MSNNLNIVIGAGTTNYPGWIATDLPFFNILKSKSWQFLFGNRQIDHLLAEHVFEHLTEQQARQALDHIFVRLKKGGNFRLAVPDALHPDKLYIDAVKPGGWDLGADDHKSFWSYQSIRKVAREWDFKRGSWSTTMRMEFLLLIPIIMKRDILCVVN